MDITQTTSQLYATRANLSGSVFNDVNLAAAQFTNVDIRDCNIDGLRIDGQLVTDLLNTSGK